MDIKIYPSFLKGNITPPPSKSYLHRAIICASLSEGKSTIKNILIGDDIQQTIEAFRSLGVHIEYLNNELIIQSKGAFDFNNDHPINCLESGSTLRFLIPLLTNELGVRFIGSSSLLSRPLTIYENIFHQQNLTFNRHENHIYTKGILKPNHYSISDDTSSQFVSGLLFALPRLNGDSSIEIKDSFESRSYIDMTLYMLKSFGIKIIKKTNNYFIIPGNQSYKSNDINIEADYSQAAFFIVGALLNGDIQFHNLNRQSLQPDRQLFDIVNHKSNDGLHIKKTEMLLKDINLSQIIDLGPILFLLATQSKNMTKITHFSRLIYKESDRLKNMLDVLTQMNASYISNDNEIIIGYQPVFSFEQIGSYNDHRIAMAIAIFATFSTSPTIIRNMEVINKSYPTFLADLESLGVKIEYY